MLLKGLYNLICVKMSFSEAVERGPVLSNIAYLDAATQEGIDPEQGVPALEVRPWSFDSRVGGSTDELKKAAVEKKICKKFAEVLKCHIFASIRPTDKYFGMLGCF